MHNVHQDISEIRAIARKRNLRVWDDTYGLIIICNFTKTNL